MCVGLYIQSSIREYAQGQSYEECVEQGVVGWVLVARGFDISSFSSLYLSVIPLLLFVMPLHSFVK